MCIRDSSDSSASHNGADGSPPNRAPSADRLNHIDQPSHPSYLPGVPRQILPCDGTTTEYSQSVSCCFSFERRSQTYPRYRATESSAAIGVTPKEPHPSYFITGPKL